MNDASDAIDAVDAIDAIDAIFCEWCDWCNQCNCTIGVIDAIDEINTIDAIDAIDVNCKYAKREIQSAKFIVIYKISFSAFAILDKDLFLALFSLWIFFLYLKIIKNNKFTVMFNYLIKEKTRRYLKNIRFEGCYWDEKLFSFLAFAV